MRERAIEEWSQKTGRRQPRDLERMRRRGYEERASSSQRYRQHQVSGLGPSRYAAGALTGPLIQHSEAKVQVSFVVDALRRATLEISHAIGGRPQSE